MSRRIDPSRRENIMRAAREVFKENGYTNARISDIAQRAGVANGTVYLYFDSKIDLVQAICEEYLAKVVQTLGPIMANENQEEAISKAIHTALVLAEEERDVLRLLDLRASLGKRSERLPSGEKFSGIFEEMITRGMNQGKVYNYDPEVAGELIVGLLEWITKFCLVWTSVNINRYEDTTIRMLQHALLVKKEALPS